MFKNISVEQAREAFDKGIEFIDIREPEEFDQVRIPGARLIPMSQMNSRLQELPKETDAVVYCRSGSRSAYLLAQLSAHGYGNLMNLHGGIIDWYEAQNPVEEG